MLRMSCRGRLAPNAAFCVLPLAAWLAGCVPSRQDTQVVAIRGPIGPASAVASSITVVEPKKPARKIAAAVPKQPRPQPPAPSGEAGCGDADSCATLLRAMVDAPDRAWIKEREPPARLASGVRMFAYRALRKRLTCPELNAALEDVAAAAKTLDGPVAGFPPDHLRRVRNLASQVDAELRAERLGRCEISLQPPAPPSAAPPPPPAPALAAPPPAPALQPPQPATPERKPEQ